MHPEAAETGPNGVGEFDSEGRWSCVKSPSRDIALSYLRLANLDYVHVADIADAHVKALKHLLNGGESRALNLANARGFSVKEVAAAEMVGRTVRRMIGARRPGDPPVLIGDVGRALAPWLAAGPLQPNDADRRCVEMDAAPAITVRPIAHWTEA